MHRFRSLLKLAAIAVLVAGCDATHLIGEDGPLTACSTDSDCALDQLCDVDRRLCVRQGTTRNIDILVLLDNSASMAVRQQLFVSSFKLVFQQLEAVAASYHVAVATSDVGSTVSPSASWGPIAGSCDTFAGDDGQLQTLPCTSRIGLSTKAAAACQALCPDPSFVPAKLLPQLADTAEIVAHAKTIPGLTVAVLVPNARGAEAAIAAGADAYLTGEISEPQAHLARETGVAFLACGHHATERYGAPAVGEHLAQRFGLAHRFIDIPNPA